MNGFFSVIGSVLTTILAMTYGFRLVQFLGLVVYRSRRRCWRLQRIADRTIVVPVIHELATRPRVNVAA